MTTKVSFCLLNIINFLQNISLIPSLLIDVSLYSNANPGIVFQDQVFSNDFRRHPKVIVLTYSNPSTTERSFMKSNFLKINRVSLKITRISSRFIQH